jgi:hypothetical protein
MAEPRNLDGRRRPFRKPKERSSTLGLIHHPTIGRADSANGDGWEVAVFFFKIATAQVHRTVTTKANYC